MQNANPPRRPGRPRRSSTVQSPSSSHARVTSASALNALSGVVAANSIANSNVTTSHFLGAGTLQRPWMKPNAAANARSTATALGSSPPTRAASNQTSEGRTPAQDAPTPTPTPATETTRQQPYSREEIRLPSYRFISTPSQVPPTELVSLQNTDSNKEKDISNSNTAANHCDVSAQEATGANRVAIPDPTSTEDPSQSIQCATDSQPTISASLPVLNMSDNFHLVARNNSNPSGFTQQNNEPDHTLSHSNEPVIRSNVSAYVSNGTQHIRANSGSTLSPDQLMWASFHSNAAHPIVRSEDPNPTNPPPQNSFISSPPLRQASHAALNPHGPPAQLLTPEPSPLNRAAPLVQSQRSTQRPPPSVEAYLPRSASVHVQNRPPVVTQPVSHSRNASVSSVRSSVSTGIDARLRGLPQIQGNNLSDNRGSSYLATLESNLQDMSRRIDLNNYQWALRLPWLRDACQRNDLFFLHLNQLFCMRNMNVASVRHLGVGQDCDPGFTVMELLFGKNSLLPRELLAFLGGWPNSTYSLEVNEQTRLWTSEIIRFLPILGSSWITFRDKCLLRRVPPMVSEIIHYLACPTSLMVPRAMFCSIQKSLSPTASQDLQSAAFNLFNNNATATYRGQPGSADFQSFRSAYQAIYAQHLANPRLTQNELDEIKFVLHHDSPRTNIHPVAPTKTARVPTRTPSTQMSPSVSNSNAAGPTIGTSRDNSSGGVVSDHNRRFSSTQYASPVRGPFPSSHIQQNGQPNSNQPMHNVMGPAQSNYVRVNAVPSRFGSIQRSQSGPGPTQGSYMREHDYHQGTSGMVNVVPSNSGPSAISSLPNLTLQVQQSMISPHDTLLPAPGGRLPDLLVNPDPIQESLHQVLLRQPVTKLKEPFSDDHQRLFQFVKTFVLNPYRWVPALGFISVEFEVPEELLFQRSEVIEEFKGPFAVPQRVIDVDSVLFNLRCAKLDDLSDESDLNPIWAALPTHWPQHIFISVNGRHLELRRKRHNTKDLPVDVTPFIRAGKNELTISTHPEPNERNVNHGIVVEVIGFCDYKTALTLPNKISAETSLKAITDAMKPGHDSDDDLILVDDMMTISVTDPFSSRIFTTPVRGETCKHRECFDLETLLNSRQSDYKDQLTSVYAWQCPICRSDARPQHLVIDGFFQEVRDRIIEEGVEDEARAIVVNVDGSWHVKQNTDANQATARTSRQRSQSSRPSPGAPGAKRMRPDDSAADATERPQADVNTSRGATTNILPPQNSRIAEIIELD